MHLRQRRGSLYELLYAISILIDDLICLCLRSDAQVQCKKCPSSCRLKFEFDFLIYKYHASPRDIFLLLNRFCKDRSISFMMIEGDVMQVEEPVKIMTSPFKVCTWIKNLGSPSKRNLLSLSVTFRMLIIADILERTCNGTCSLAHIIDIQINRCIIHNCLSFYAVANIRQQRRKFKYTVI